MEKQTDFFELAIPVAKLAYTNDFWNNMKLNSAWNIGTVTSIIQQRSFDSKEEWKEYYFKSGEERLELLKAVSIEDRSRLKSIEVWNYFQASSREVNAINTTYGRTKEELDAIGDILYGAVRATNNPHQITRNDCRYMVLYRTLGETWNGLMKRERSTIETLRNVFGDEFRIEKVDGETDIKYEVDVEIFHKDVLIAGIQVKPESYLRGFKGNKKTYAINARKNEAYTQLKGVPVFYIYSSTDGKIYNFDILKEIAALIEQEEQIVI